MPDHLQLVTTADGSHSILNIELNEHYHSVHGAVQESMHVFIRMGLNYWLAKNIGKHPCILEIGMGTGLNVLLTAKAQMEIGFTAHYETLEPYPIPSVFAQKLNYTGTDQNPLLEGVFSKIHDLTWDEAAELVAGFTLLKHQRALQDYQPDRPFDLIYFDAFAPNKQADMWTLPLFEKLYDALNVGGMLVTYCAKGQFKRDLKAAGFTVETLDGPPGKKEMVRGLKG